MSYRTILVHLSNAEHAGQVLEVATNIAAKHEAYLIGLFAYPQVFVPAAVAAEAWPDIVEIENKRHAEMAGEIEGVFNDVCKAAKLKSAWRTAEVMAPVANVVIRHAFCADLVVVGQADPDSDDARMQAEVTERVLMECGRPVLFVPYAGHFKTVAEEPLIAWTASRESARAAFDALPLLRNSKSVKVLTVNPQEQNGQSVSSTATQFALSLARHGVNAQASTTASGELSVGSELLSRASDYGTDLLVMGGYGHSRFREIVFGGATREILQHMTVPVLMSH